MAPSMMTQWKPLSIGFAAGIFVGINVAMFMWTRSAVSVSGQTSVLSTQHADALSDVLEPQSGSHRGPGLVNKLKTSDAAIDVMAGRQSDGSSPNALAMIQHNHKVTNNDGPIPVWIWMDYDKLPGFIELNLRVLQHNAPSPQYTINYVTPQNIKTLVPDMPEEFDRMPYAAATSDLIRTAIIAHHGGVYMDTDFLVQHPLHEFTDLLQDYDFVSYTSHGQDCQKGQFSSNFVAGRKGNALYHRSWETIKQKLKRRCMHKDGDKLQGVCCYTAAGAPRKCHIPWAGVGERTSHPELKQLLEEGVFKIHCYGAEKSFVPQITNKNSPPKEFKLDSGHIAWTVLDSTVCKRVDDTLTCSKDGEDWLSESQDYFARVAYHLFSSIFSNNVNRAYTPEELLTGKWAISELYRSALRGARPPDLPAELEALPRWFDKHAVRRTVGGGGAKVGEVAGALTRPPVVEQKCTDTLARWASTALNRSDDFQCNPSDVTFVHIPKTAGTTIEGLARTKLGLVWGHDYDMKRWDMVKRLEQTGGGAVLPPVTTVNTSVRVCTKSCPCNKGCCWWHVPPRFLVDWRPYYLAPYRFCVVRNPFKRMLSQYSYSGVYACPDTPAKLEQRDAYIVRHLEQYRQGAHHAADCHFIPQARYVADTVDAAWLRRLFDTRWGSGAEALQAIRALPTTSAADAWSCNVVLRFENLAADLQALSAWTGVDVTTEYRKPYTAKCTNALKPSTVELIRSVYAEDFQRFGYSTDWETY